MSTSYIKSSGDLILQTDSELNFFGTPIDSNTVSTFGGVPVSNLDSLSDGTLAANVNAGTPLLDDGTGSFVPYEPGAVSTEYTSVASGETMYSSPKSVWVSAISRHLFVYFDVNTTNLVLKLYEEGNSTPTYTTTISGREIVGGNTSAFEIVYDSVQDRVYFVYVENSTAYVEEFEVTATSITSYGAPLSLGSSGGIVLKAYIRPDTEQLVAVCTASYSTTNLLRLVATVVLTGSTKGAALSAPNGGWYIWNQNAPSTSRYHGPGIGLEFMYNMSNTDYYVAAYGCTLTAAYGLNGMYMFSVDVDPLSANYLRIYEGPSSQILANSSTYDIQTIYSDPTNAIFKYLVMWEELDTIKYAIVKYQSGFTLLTNSTLGLPTVNATSSSSPSFRSVKITDSKILLVYKSGLKEVSYARLDYNSSDESVSVISPTVIGTSSQNVTGFAVSKGDSSIVVGYAEYAINSSYNTLSVATVDTLSVLGAAGVLNSDASSGATPSYTTVGKIYTSSSSLGLSPGSLYWLSDSGFSQTQGSYDKFYVVALSDRSYQIRFVL